MQSTIKKTIQQLLSQLYSTPIIENQIQLSETPSEYIGDFSLVVFPFLKLSKLSPEKTAEQIGSFLITQIPDWIASFNVIKGFLNIIIHEEKWLTAFQSFTSIIDKPNVPKK